MNQAPRPRRLTFLVNVAVLAVVPGLSPGPATATGVPAGRVRVG